MSKQLRTYLLFGAIVLVLVAIGWINNDQDMSNPLSLARLILGLLSPTLAAVITAGVLYGRKSVKDLFVGIVKNIKVKWLLIAVLIQIGVSCAAFFLYSAIHGFDVALGSVFSLSSFYSIPLAFAYCFIQNIWEEIGWRGFLIRNLSSKYSLFATALLVGLLWGVWHLPLLLNPLSAMNQFNPFIYIVSIMFLSVVYSFVFVRSGWGILSVTFFHSMGNTFAGTFSVPGVNAAHLFYCQIAVMAAVAVVLLIWKRKMFFGKGREEE